MPSYFFFKFSSPKADIKCLAHVKKKKKKTHDVSHCLLTSNPLERNCVHSSFSLCSPYYSLKIVLQSYLQTYSSVSIPWETLKRLQALSVAARCCKWMSLAIHRAQGPMWLPEPMDAQVP